MQYIILDLEWNQSYRGKKYAKKGLPFEVIEIGAIRFNEQLQETGRFNELIRPVVYRDMNRITGNLVHITMEDLSKARGFYKVMSAFASFCGEDCIFCTWGNLDLVELQRNMRYHGMKPLTHGPIPFLDIQKLFALQTEGKKYQHALEFAIDYYQLDKDMPFHRALSDAYYTSRVMQQLDPAYLQLFSYDTFYLPRSKKEEVHTHFPTYYKHITMGYEKKYKLLRDKDVFHTRCHLCGQPALVECPWFSHNGKHYQAVLLCEKHGLIKCKARLRKNDDELNYIVKTMKQIEREDAVKIRELYEAKVLAAEETGKDVPLH